MRTRLAVKEPPKYDAVRNNFEWADHAARTLATASLIAWLAPEHIWDPACGDASILSAAYALRPFTSATLEDMSYPQIAQLHANPPKFRHVLRQANLIESLEQTSEFYVQDSDKTELLLLTEVLEHLEDPDHVLRMARRCARRLIASSPIGDPELGRNHEHLWAWDTDGYGEMLRAAGWEPVATMTLDFPGIAGNSQIWVAR